MCALSRCMRTVSQTCGNSWAPNIEKACEWHRAAAYPLSFSAEALLRPPEKVSRFRSLRISSVLIMISNVQGEGRGAGGCAACGAESSPDFVDTGFHACSFSYVAGDT